MADDQGVQKVSFTRRFLDKQLNPWDYVDDELPTTIVLRGAAGRVATRAPRGTAAEGSYHITGSNYDFNPGTYSLRITRLSLSVQGTNHFQGTVFQWHIRHSRKGTIDVQAFGEQGRILAVGHRRAPIYMAGPGTLFWGWDTFKGEFGTQVTVSQSMEAIPG